MFESTTPGVTELITMIPRLQRAVQDPSQMGSFLESVSHFAAKGIAILTIAATMTFLVSLASSLIRWSVIENWETGHRLTV